MEQPFFDAPLPAEMARKAADVGVTKASLPFWDLVPLGVLAGAFISLGAMLSTVATTRAGVLDGPARLLGGLAFSLGLLLVVVGGAELFTGNNLIVVAFASRRVTLNQLLRNWLIVYVANFAGAVVTALLVFESGQYESGTGAVGVRALQIAKAKSDLSVREAFVLGVLANALVCLAVWMCLAARTVVDKAIAIVGPVTAFVAGGFEHSIANMYFLPIGIFIKEWAPTDFWERTNLRVSDFDSVTWRSFIVSNLVPVTVGNVIGGAGMVAVVYWFVYLRKRPVRD